MTRSSYAININSVLRGLVNIGFAGILLCASMAKAADITLVLRNVNGDGGNIRAAICDKPSFLTYDCPYRQIAETRPGDVTIVFRNVAPGTWAGVAYHDVNLNGKLDTNFLGIPTEQFGVTNNPGFNHKPSFEEAKFIVGDEPVSLSIDLPK